MQFTKRMTLQERAMLLVYQRLHPNYLVQLLQETHVKCQVSKAQNGPSKRAKLSCSKRHAIGKQCTHGLGLFWDLSQRREDKLLVRSTIKCKVNKETFPFVTNNNNNNISKQIHHHFFVRQELHLRVVSKSWIHQPSVYFCLNFNHPRFIELNQICHLSNPPTFSSSYIKTQKQKKKILNTQSQRTLIQLQFYILYLYQQTPLKSCRSGNKS